jgi:hypothetical protein
VPLTRIHGKTRIDNYYARRNAVLNCSGVARILPKHKLNVQVFWDRRYISTTVRTTNLVENKYREYTVEGFAGALMVNNVFS